MGTIKMSLMPKGINKIIYNPGVSISTPEYLLVYTLPTLSTLGVLIFSSGCHYVESTIGAIGCPR